MGRIWILGVAVSAALGRLGAASAATGLGCPMVDLMTFERDGDIYTTYYCDFYDNACPTAPNCCDDSPDGVGELTGQLDYPVFPCGEQCVACSTFTAEGKCIPCSADEAAAKSASAGCREVSLVDFPGLPFKVHRRSYRHQFPRGEAAIVLPIGTSRVVEVRPPGEPTFKALEIHYRTVIIDNRPGQPRQRWHDFFVAFEATNDIDGAIDDIYGDGPAGETVTRRGAKALQVDTATEFQGPDQPRRRKFVLVLRAE